MTIPIGLLFSTKGPYGALGETMLQGALLAIDELNANPNSAVTITPTLIDPAGVNANYVSGAQKLLHQHSVQHVVGCYTSSSRKEVLPVFEKYDGLLWYPSHYEGFETSENIVYTGAAPNQHVVPLTHFLLGQGQKTAVFIGSNYIWAWENNRVMREILQRNGGRVLAERYIPVGETAIEELVALAIKARPDFIFSTLIGDSAYSFLRQLRAQCLTRGINQPQELPVTSCSISEPELREIGPEACDGHLTSSVYFSSIDSPRNRDWLAHWDRLFPSKPGACADAEASYNAVHALAAAATLAGSPTPEAVLAMLGELRLSAPQGELRFDPDTRHCWLWPRIGRSTREGRFDILNAVSMVVPPDPYLIWEPLDMPQKQRQHPNLSVIK